MEYITMNISSSEGGRDSLNRKLDMTRGRQVFAHSSLPDHQNLVFYLV